MRFKGFMENEIINAIDEISKSIKFELPKHLEVDSVKCESGFKIEKAKNNITIHASNKTNLLRALFVLSTEQYKDEFKIEQQCQFEEFGIMLDLSRNAVMNVETLKHQIRLMALMGYNVLQLYTEDTIEVDNEPYFGYMRGALTKSEIKEVDQYCKLFDIELVPCIQCLAHLNQITRYEEYSECIDVDDILLVGHQRTYALLENMVKTISSSFSSRKVNIGMDEAHMLGLGKYLDQNGYQNRVGIMLNHLNRVKEICEKYGFEPQMWSDMFYRLVYNGVYDIQDSKSSKDISEEVFKQIPKDVRLIYWDYYSLEYNKYNKMLKSHLSFTDNIGYAAGAWKWTGFTPHNTYSIEAGRQSLKACKDNNTKCFLLTCWGDNGAEASLYSILPSFYAYAEFAYTGDISKEGFKTLTGVEYETFMLVDLPNEFCGDAIQRNNLSKIFLYNDLLQGAFDCYVETEFDAIFSEYGAKLKNVVSPNDRYYNTFNVLSNLCDVLSVKTNLSKIIKEAYDRKDKTVLSDLAKYDLPRLNEKLNNFYNSFEKQWHSENKSFGFEVHCIRLGGLIKRTEYVISQLNRYTEGKIDRIDELEVQRLDFAYFRGLGLDKISYNRWSDMVSTSVI